MLCLHVNLRQCQSFDGDYFRIKFCAMNLYRLDLVSLSLFTLIARTGSISKGSKLACIAVGAASKRITDLELAVGAELFERHSRGVTLTFAGRALRTHAQRILSNVDALAADLSDHAQGVIGIVRLWTNTSAITQFLPDDLASFIVTHPGIRIEMQEQDSQAVMMAVLDGRADLGIFADRTPTQGLQTLPYRRDRLVLVVPTGHPLTLRKTLGFSEAADYDFVSLAEGTSLAQRLVLETNALGKSLRIRIHVRSFDAMCRMVAVGLGIAVLPELAVQPFLMSMGLSKVELSDDWVERSLLLCARDFKALPKPARTLVNHLQTVWSQKNLG